jgi:hypothetical protein
MCLVAQLSQLQWKFSDDPPFAGGGQVPGGLDQKIFQKNDHFFRGLLQARRTPGAIGKWASSGC